MLDEFMEKVQNYSRLNWSQVFDIKRYIYAR